MTPIDDIPTEERVRILTIRLQRAERILLDAEMALEGRMRELDKANKELSRRESELVERLDIESRQLLSALSTANMASIYGQTGQPFRASSDVGKLLGLPGGDFDDELLAKLIDAIHPLDRDRILRSSVEFFNKMAPGVDRLFEHRITRYDTGATHWLSWVIRREVSNGERPSSVYGTVRDITYSRANERAVRVMQLRAERRVAELNRLSQQLGEEQARTADALSARTDFLTEMAHEVRTPLNSLNGAIELLYDAVGADMRELQVVREATDQLMGIASKLIEQADGDAPQPDPSRSQKAQSRGKSEGLEQAPRVLVAEDTESNRYVIERMLKNIGCEPTMVVNGVEALEAIRSQTFDLVLMDVMMPIMDGRKATQAIRALDGSVSRLPIIGVTAHSLQAERENLLAAGMTACLSKPVRREQLEEAIRTALIGREVSPAHSARFDHELFERAFFDLPPAYRERMRDAAKKDISDYGQAVLDSAKAGNSQELSRAAHSLKGVSLNVGAIGIVEELSLYREKLEMDPTFSSSDLRKEIASALLGFDDLFSALVQKAQ